MSFNDDGGNKNKILDAEEKAEIRFTIENKGQGDAYAIIAQIEDGKKVKGTQIPTAYTIGDLQAGAKKNVIIPISGLQELETSSPDLNIKVVEGKNTYAGTTRNGITTSEWGGWDLSFQFVSAPMSYKATISPGGVEWSYTNPNASWLSGNSRLLIDMRQVGSIDPTRITNTKIFDAYDGAMTYTSHDANGWAIYTVPSPLTKITNGTSTSNSYNSSESTLIFLLTTSNINFLLLSTESVLTIDKVSSIYI